MMENLVKGWVTSTIGLLIMLATAAHFFGIYDFPSTGQLSKPVESAISFCVGLALFIVKKSVLEEQAEKIIKRKSDKI